MWLSSRLFLERLCVIHSEYQIRTYRSFDGSKEDDARDNRFGEDNRREDSVSSRRELEIYRREKEIAERDLSLLDVKLHCCGKIKILLQLNGLGRD